MKFEQLPILVNPDTLVTINLFHGKNVADPVAFRDTDRRASGNAGARALVNLLASYSGREFMAVLAAAATEALKAK